MEEVEEGRVGSANGLSPRILRTGQTYRLPCAAASDTEGKAQAITVGEPASKRAADALPPGFPSLPL